MASQSSASGEVGHRGFIETSVGAADRVAADSDTRMPNIMPIDKNKLLELKAKLSSPGGEGGPHGNAERVTGSPAKRKSPVKTPISPPKFSAAMATGQVVELGGREKGHATSTTPEPNNDQVEDPMQELFKRIEVLEKLNIPAQVFDVVQKHNDLKMWMETAVGQSTQLASKVDKIENVCVDLSERITELSMIVK